MNRKERRSKLSQQSPASAPRKGARPGGALERLLKAGLEQRSEGRLNEAQDSFEQALSMGPENARVLCELANLQRMLDQPSKALANLQRALRSAPRNPEILANLAVTMRDTGDTEGALRAFTKCVDWRPGYHQAHSELAATYQMLGQLDAAIASYRDSLAIEGRQPTLLSNMGFACLENGDPEGALEATDKCFAKFPNFATAVVVKAMALTELDRAEEAQALMDLDALVLEIPIEEAEGFDSVADFNQALVQHVTTHPSLAFEPNQRTTIHGQQTGELNRAPKGPMESLELVIQKAMLTFFDSLPQGTDHPFMGVRPKEFNLSMWATILGSEGHQVPHIHPVAWTSGVYYAQVPNEIQPDDDKHAGWIEFGQVPDQYKLKQAMPVKLKAPKVGTLVLFPSFVYHRTIPFVSDTQRISIAFDALPSA
ncbi:MAG: Tfp pilus assembly protein PilF [Planctomycetota bacterium]|jgi:Tfp pilus assembly protein PilF